MRKKINIIVLDFVKKEEKDSFVSFLTEKNPERIVNVIFNNSINTMKAVHSCVSLYKTEVKFITKKTNKLFLEIRESSLLESSLEKNLSLIRKNKREKNILKEKELFLKKNSDKKFIVILGEGEFNRNQYVQATNYFGKGYSFIFLSVENEQYCESLIEIEKYNKLAMISYVFVFIEFKTSKYFLRDLRRNLNRRKTKLRKELVNVDSFLIDLKNGTTENFFKKDEPDRKKTYYRTVA